MKIGFIGLGNVGGKLARSLLRNKFNLTVIDLNKSLVKDFLAKGSVTAKSPKELAEKADLIITCLPSPKICAEVMEKKKWSYRRTFERKNLVRNEYNRRYRSKENRLSLIHI